MVNYRRIILAMDETTGQLPSTSPELDPKRAHELESAQRLLFEGDYIPEGCEDIVESRTGQLRPRDRAMMAFNNLTNFLPGTWGDGSPKTREDVQEQQFIKDFVVVAGEEGVDMKKVEELNHGEVHSTSQRDGDSVLDLYRYVYPAMERLIKEKGYKVIW